MCFLVLRDQSALLLDAGTGAGRLVEPEIARLVSGCDRLDVILSHYHADHVVGLYALIEGWSKGDIHIWAPAPPLTDVDSNGGLTGFLGPPFLGASLVNILDLEILTYEGERIYVGPWRVQLRRQNHPGGSVGMRFDNSFAYVTDTPADEDTIAFVQGVDILLHEVWLTDEEAIAKPDEAARHASMSGVADIANQAEVRRLLPVHHWPRRSEQSLGKLCADLNVLTKAQVLYPKEGEVINLR